MLRASGIALLLAVLSLTVSSFAWLRAAAPVAKELEGDPNAVLAAFERGPRPSAEIDLGARYAGRRELLDPRQSLPSWHRSSRVQAAAVFAATRQCPPSALAVTIDDASLGKAYAWHERTCSLDASRVEELIERPPFVHPSGASYAALALAAGSPSPSFVAGHERALHVLELKGVEPALLSAEGRALRELSSREWEAIAHGDRLVLSPSSFIVVERGPLGDPRLRIYPRIDWERAARAASLALAPRAALAACPRPASARLCWETLSPVERHRRALVIATGTSASVALLAAFALAFAYIRERRRMQADRIHVFRTLTHELRTPAMSLGLDIEPLRAAYDELPASCQEPLLRISDGIARLSRVLHRSAKYMALFETTSSGLVTLQRIDSARAMMADFAEEWPEGVTVAEESADGALETDPEWLGVAVRNLVENGFRHGKPPVAVTWALAGGALVIRVADGGASPGLSLRRAVAAYHRDAESPGLGLGLAIVDRVARRLGGKLEHEGVPTVFRLTVPAAPGKVRPS